MSEEFKKVDLVTIADGAAVERFQVEMERVVENICDINTEAKRPRVITLTIEFHPNENRMGGTVVVGAKSKLVAYDKHESSFYTRKDEHGEISVYGTTVEQEELFPEPRVLPAARGGEDDE